MIYRDYEITGSDQEGWGFIIQFKDDMGYNVKIDNAETLYGSKLEAEAQAQYSKMDFISENKIETGETVDVTQDIVFPDGNA